MDSKNNERFNIAGEIKNGMMKVNINCPDGIVGCAVAHYKWIPVVEKKKKETLEEMVNRITANNEQLEVKYAILAETFENLLDDIDNSVLPRGSFYELRRDGRNILNGVVDND